MDDVDEDNLYGDTKALRKSMFICQHERDDHIMSAKLKRLGWMKRRYGQQLNDECLGVPTFDIFPFHCRALSSADILEHIVMHLPNRDLLTCRLVCKYWSLEMTYFLSKRKSLVVAEDQCLNAEGFIKKRKEGQPIAVSKLGLFDVSSNCPLYKKLFQVFGRTLSSVSLEGCSPSPADFKQMLFFDAPNIQNFHFREDCPFPNNNRRRGPKVNTLKQIKILNNGNLLLPQMKMLHWDEHNSQTELKEFIEACPNLVTLELRNFPLPRSQAYKNLKWESLRSMFLSPKNVLENEHCKALTYLNLKLEKLTLFGLNSSDQKTMKSLSKFLSTLADNLEILELWLDYGAILLNEGTGHHSPLTVVLPKVTRLHTESEILGHVNNLRKLPAIKDLEIVSNHHEQQNWTTLTKRAVMTPQANNNLRSFRCGDIDCKSLEKVMKGFPFITSLNIYASHVDDKLVRSIFTNLELLVDLTISPCLKTHLLPVSDSGITGMRADKCLKARKNLDKFDDSTIKEWQSQPHIGKLQFLQKLDLSFSVSNMMTDVAILFGISRLTKLNTLRLPICRITDASISAIEKRLEQLVILGVGGCKQISSKAIADFKQHRRGILIDSNLPEMLEKLS